MNRLRTFALTSILLPSSVFVLLGSTAVHAQDASSFDGKWTVKWSSGSNGSPTEATLELNGSSGSFRQLVKTRRGSPDPCLTVAAPVSAEKSGDELLVIAKFSEAVKGCADRTIKFKKVSDRALEGAFRGSGVQVSAVKE